MERAVVVAHPDDEVLWAGGLILRFPGDWTIICCSVPRVDPIRVHKFTDSCIVLNAIPRVINVQESGHDEHLPGLDYLDLEEFDYILTHNAHGEYGHSHHKEVHSHVMNNYPHKEIATFGHHPDGEGSHMIVLSVAETEKKLEALKCYNHVLPYNGKDMTKWEALLDRYVENGEVNFNVETFNGKMP